MFFELGIVLLIVGVVLYFTIAPALAAACIVIGVVLLLVGLVGRTGRRW